MSQLALKTTDLTKRYRRRTVLDGINVHVMATEIYGLIGLNGAGKTTLLSCLAGLIRPTAGGAEVLGYRLPGEYGKVLARMGVLIGRPAFYPFLTGSENLAELMQARCGRRGPARVREVLAMVGLSGAGQQRFGAYSEGMRHRLALAAALLFKPELVLLDEPTEGLDPRGVSDTREIFLGLRDAGATIVFSSHALGEVEAVADRIAIIHNGRVLAEAAPRDLISQASDLREGKTERRHGSELERAFLALTSNQGRGGI